MLTRGACVLVAALAFVLAIGQAANAGQKNGDKEKVHEGKLVKAGDNEIVMTDVKGENKHTHKVPADAKIICDGKACKLSDLKAGSMIMVTTRGPDQTVVRIEAKTQRE